MRDWPAHKWIGAAMMFLGAVQVLIGLRLLLWGHV